MNNYIGEWICGNSKEKYTGQLNCNSDGKWSLSIEVSSEKLNININDEDIFIKGRLLDKRSVTILSGSVKNIKYGCHQNSELYNIVEFDCDLVIIGPYFDKKEDVTFRRVIISYSYLKEWLNKSYFELDPEIDSSDTIIKIEAKKPKRINIKNGEEEINIQYDSSVKINKNRVEIKYKPYVEFIFERPLVYEEMLEEIEKVSKLLTVFIGERVYINKITFAHENTRVDIYDSRLEKKDETIKRNKIVIRYSDVENNLMEICGRWYDKLNKFNNIINNFVSLSSSKIIMLEYLFIMVVQALESFSREIRNNDSSFKEKIKSILIETNFILNIKDTNIIDEFAYRITKTRNYLVHLDDSSANSKRFGETDMFYVGKYLVIVLQSLILKEIGCDEEMIKNSVNKKYEYIIKYVSSNIINTL